MKKKSNSAQSRELTEIEIGTALHAALRDEGLLMPCTAEDISKLRADLAGHKIPTPDSNKFRKLLEEREKSKLTSGKSAHTASPSWLKENLALAARHGGKISGASRKKMDDVWAKRGKRKSKDL